MRRWGVRVVASVCGALLALSGIAGGGAAAEAVEIGGGPPISVGDSASGMATTPDGRYLYVTVQSAAQVRVIDTERDHAVPSLSIPVGAWPRGIAMSADGASAYVVNSSANSVSVIDTASNTVRATVALGMVPYANPWSAAISPDGDRLYVSAMQGGQMSIVDLDTFESRTVPMPGYYGGGLALSPDGSRVYVMSANGAPYPTLAVFDTATEAVVSFGFPGAPTRAMTSLAVSPDGSRLYATIGEGIYVFDATDPQLPVLDTVTVEVLGSLLLSADGTRLYASRLSGGGGIDVYDTGRMTVTESIPVDSPSEMVLSPDGGTLWAVLGRFSNLVTAFPRPVPPALGCELPAGTVGVAYSAGVVRGGSPAPSVTLVSGALPQGLALSGDGVVSGTPTAAGAFAFSLSATNASGTVSCEGSITIGSGGGAGAEGDAGGGTAGVGGSSDTGGGSAGAGGLSARGASDGRPAAGATAGPRPDALSATGSTVDAPAAWAIAAGLLVGAGVLALRRSQRRATT